MKIAAPANAASTNDKMVAIMTVKSCLESPRQRGTGSRIMIILDVESCGCDLLWYASGVMFMRGCGLRGFGSVQR